MTRTKCSVMAALVAGGWSGAHSLAQTINAGPGAASSGAAQADCDRNGQADAFDFICFQRLLASGDPAADCDGSGSLDVLDFLCFQAAFAAWNPDGAAPPAPGEWCLTQQRYLEALRREGINPLDVACAQFGPCDDPANRNAAIPTELTPVKTYRLTIHVFCDDDGTNCAATANDVAVAVGRLNTDFAPWRIQFIYQWRYVNSTAYRNLANSEASAMKTAYVDSPASKLNVYVAATENTASWATFPWSSSALATQGGIVMHDAWFAAGSPIPQVFAHEVGHCLGLWHVFHGVSEVTECSACYEAAGRPPAEGDVTGDLCADTEPTTQNLNNCFDPPGTDPCSGNPWVGTPYLNYMSYSHVCPPYEFTPHQGGRMHCWAAARLTGWLDTPAAPGSPTLTKINGGQVRVAWSDNSSNENGFRVQREKKSGGSWINTTTVATVGAGVTTVNDTPGAGTFRYRVQAFNDSGDSAWSAWKQIKN